MRFDRLSIHNLGPFSQVDIDLNALPGKLTAVCGPNGAGKSTLLELLAAALYREAPTRGTLADLATARDSFVEVGITNGAKHTVRQSIDNITGKGETLLLNAAGDPHLDNAKVSAADRWIAEHLPSADVLYNSSFAAQGRRGFLDLTKSERKQLLVQLLDLGRFERMATEARERATFEKQSLEIHRARLRDLPAVDMDALRQAEGDAATRAEWAQSAHENARKALERARAAAGDAARALELVEQRKAVEARREVSLKQVGDVELRLANNRDVLARGDEIRAAAERLTALEIERSAADQLVAASKTELAELQRDQAESERHRQTQVAAATQASQREVACLRRLADREAIEAASAVLADKRVQEAALVVGVADWEAEVSGYEQLLLLGKDRRISHLRDGLVAIATADAEDAPFQSWAQSSLSTDDGLADAAAKAPIDLRHARDALSKARADLEALRATIVTQERLAARANEMASAAADLEKARADGRDAAHHLGLCEELLTVIGAKLFTAQSTLFARQASVSDLDQERSALQPLAAQVPRLATAEARIEELTASLRTLQAALAAANTELAALPVVEALAVDLGTYEREVVGREIDHQNAQATLTRAQDAVKAGEERVAKRVELEARVVAIEAELADWTRLAQDLGRDGLQALELDAALPEINTIANSLLHRCLGTRFTVELKTDRLSSDGKKIIEDLEVRVLDTVNGRDADADTYSGGELVLVGSAISLALTTLACRRSGSEAPTLILDEAGAALDAANGRAWIAMLRLAVNEIGASRCLFITHSDELQDLADSQIRISDGQVVLA